MGATRICVWCVLAVAACGDDGAMHVPDSGGGNKVHAVAHVVAGPSATARTLPPSPSDPTTTPPIATARLAPPPAVTDGNWVVSPDKVKATLVSISYTEAPSGGGPGDNAMLTSCQFEYTRSANANASLLDCPFDIAPGTYKGFGISISTTYELLIDDATNGLYTDPASATLLATTDRKSVV